MYMVSCMAFSKSSNERMGEGQMRYVTQHEKTEPIKFDIFGFKSNMQNSHWLCSFTRESHVPYRFCKSCILKEI